VETKKQWYKEWFNSPYYRLLYRNHDEGEAFAFIDRLVQYLQPQPGAAMLDVACGRGRYANELAFLGFDVTGIDLSENNILEARKTEHDHLSFFQHDMRLPFRICYFDFVFNFFSSFGYFDTARDNENALHTMCHALKRGGLLVIDYLNSEYVKQHLIQNEFRVIEGVEFSIRREYNNGYFLKEIDIMDPARLVERQFTEGVRAFSRNDFEGMLSAQGMQIEKVFGDYHLNPWNDQLSPRMILLARRIA
jgi:SAM-dependent methyltransferase